MAPLAWLTTNEIFFIAETLAAKIRPTVNMHIFPGHEACFIRDQENGPLSDFRGLSKSTQGKSLLH